MGLESIEKRMREMGENILLDKVVWVHSGWTCLLNMEVGSFLGRSGWDFLFRKVLPTVHVVLPHSIIIQLYTINTYASPVCNTGSSRYIILLHLHRISAYHCFRSSYQSQNPEKYLVTVQSDLSDSESQLASIESCFSGTPAPLHTLSAFFLTPFRLPLPSPAILPPSLTSIPSPTHSR